MNGDRARDIKNRGAARHSTTRPTSDRRRRRVDHEGAFLATAVTLRRRTRAARRETTTKTRARKPTPRAPERATDDGRPTRRRRTARTGSHVHKETVRGVSHRATPRTPVRRVHEDAQTQAATGRAHRARHWARTRTRERGGDDVRGERGGDGGEDVLRERASGGGDRDARISAHGESQTTRGVAVSVAQNRAVLTGEKREAISL